MSDAETMTLTGANWLQDALLQDLLAALGAAQGKTRIVGGAVRNALMGVAIGDVDLATEHLPDETITLLKAAGFKAIPTGIEHGTVMAVKDGRSFEITTLRADVETDGRHAKVAFGATWEGDARRRDFTINALYCDHKGAILDPVGGMADIGPRNVRFIGDAEARIKEDYLRILRFYRFFASYGGGRPDAAGLKATAKLKSGLTQLSAERVWSELRKILGAKNPVRAMLWMRTASVLTTILPETELWGIDSLGPLIEAEEAMDWQADALLRLIAITPHDEARRKALAERLKLSNDDKQRLIAHAMQPEISVDLSAIALRKMIYLGSHQAIKDRLYMSYANARAKNGPLGDDVLKFAALIKCAKDYIAPIFPLKGSDLAEQGVSAGPQMGQLLKQLENDWIASNFTLGREELLAKI